MNILQVMEADKNLTTMLRTIKAAGLERELSNTGPYTLFAPSEKAFGTLAGGANGAFLKPENRSRLSEIINNHIVAGKKKISDLKDGQKLKTLNGKELEVRLVDKLVIINGSTIQSGDADASNGVVHTVDKIIMPSVPAVTF